MNATMRMAAALLAGAVVLPGCLERTETITIGADGMIRYRAAFETDTEAEFTDWDATPSLEGGWLVDSGIRRDEEGKTTYTLVAESFFGPDRPLPANFAAPRDDAPDVVLQFPTDFRVEERSDGVYYHFHRRYEGRAWAYLQNARQLVEEYLERFEGRDPEDMTDAERAGLVKVMARFEMMRFERYARFAFLDVFADEPQDVWLRVRDAILTATDVLDLEATARLLVGTGDEQADKEALAQAAEAFETMAIDRMRVALRRDAGIVPPRVRAFMDRFERHRRYDRITEDLGDDSFTINVVMPGTIVAHNADRVAGRTATWTFGGPQFRDTDLELMVTSRVLE